MPLTTSPNFVDDLTTPVQQATTEFVALKDQLLANFLKLGLSVPSLSEPLSKIATRLRQPTGFIAAGLYSEDDVQSLPEPVRTQTTEGIRQLISLHETIKSHEKLLNAGNKYIEDLEKIQVLLQEDSINQNVKTAVQALITSTQESGFSLKHAEAMHDVHLFLANPQYEPYCNIDAFPGGIQHFDPICWLQLTGIGGLFATGLSNPHANPHAALFILGIATLVLVAICAYAAYDHVTACRTGIAKAMEGVVTAILADKVEKKFINAIEKLTEHQDDETIGATVNTLIQEITALKELKSNSNQPIDALNNLLDHVNTLVEKGTTDSVNQFLSKYNTTAVSFRKHTAFFMTSDQYKLDQAVTAFSHALLNHPSMETHAAEQVAHFKALWQK